MSKGFLVLAQNTESVDYVKQAYILALSIKATQKTVNNISLITNDIVSDEYRQVFDKVIPILWEDDATDSKWKIENRWKMYYQTPYDETIVLDTDMLVLEDISEWWSYCKDKDLLLCSTIKNYRNEVIKQDPYHRKTFIVNELPNVYSALHYFKKSNFASDFYKVLGFVVRNWQLCYQKFAPTQYQNWLSIDLAMAITVKMLDIEHIVVDQFAPFEFVHMKPALQGMKPSPTTWQSIFYQHLNKNDDFFVGNYRQRYVFHYVEKDFVNDNLLLKLKQRLAHGK